LTRIDQSLRRPALKYTGCNRRIRGLFVFSNLSWGVYTQTHSTLMKPSVVEWLAAHDKRAEPRHPRSGAPIHPKQPRGTRGATTRLTVAGNRKFESISLLRRVCCELRAKARGRNLGRPSSSPRTSGPTGFVAATGANRSAISPAAITSTRARFVSYVEWTPDGLLRHVVYLGEREDKLASEVRRSRPHVGEP